MVLLVVPYSPKLRSSIIHSNRMYLHRGWSGTHSNKTQTSLRKYFIKLSHRRNNSSYASARSPYQSNTVCPIRSVPGIGESLNDIKLTGLSFFSLPSSSSSICSSIALSKGPAFHRVLWFPMKKKLAKLSNISASLLFRHLTSTFPPSAVFTYSYGSLSENSGSTTCAIHILRLNIDKSWSLSSHTSIFTAELYGI